MITLECTRYRTEIEPERGGMISAFDTTGGVPLLKSDRRHGLIHGFPTWGIPLLTPFTNRLDPRVLPSRSGSIEMPLNWPDEGLAIHGTVFDKPWEVLNVSDQAATLSCAVPDRSGLQIGTARLNARLDDSDGLRLTLTFRNESGDALSVGAGFHPWFPGNATLDFEALHRLVPDQRLLPRRAEPCGTQRLTMADDGHDLCYAGWTGQATLTSPDWRTPLILTSHAPCLHTFVGSRYDGICAEPVSHAPNAAHIDLSAEYGPMTVLSDGAELDVDMGLRLSV